MEKNEACRLKASEEQEALTKNFHNKMKEHAKDAKKEWAKREGGPCMPGVGLDGGYILAKQDIPAPLKKKPKRLPSVCPLPLCGLKGHKTKHSLKCKCNPKNPNCVGEWGPAGYS